MSEEKVHLDALFAAVAKEKPPQDDARVRAMAQEALVAARARPSLLPWASVALALLGAVGAWWLMSRTGEPELARETAPPVERVVVEREPAALSVIVLPSGDRLALAAGAAFEVVDTTRESRRVRLDAGKVVFDVARLGDGGGFVVETPHLEVHVVGTVFQVEVDHDDSSVSVFEGRVRIERDGSQHELGVGESYNASPEDRSFRGFVEAAVAARHAEPAPAHVDEPAPALALPSLARARRLLGERRYAAARAECRRANSGEVDWLLIEADAAKAMGDRGHAVALLQRAVARATPTRAIRYGYQAAQLQVQLDDCAGALSTLDATSADAAGSPLEERATALRGECLYSLGRTAELQIVARRYLVRFPAGAARDWMERATQQRL